MNQKDNFRTTKHDGDTLGQKGNDKEVKKHPAPKEADRESLNTPEENQVYVDLEPDELHVGEEPVEEVKPKKKK